MDGLYSYHEGRGPSVQGPGNLPTRGNRPIAPGGALSDAGSAAASAASDIPDEPDGGRRLRTLGTSAERTGATVARYELTTVMARGPVRGHSHRNRLNFPRFSGHPVKPEGNFRREVSNEPEEKEVFS
jgi:hypothetical protein